MNFLNLPHEDDDVVEERYIRNILREKLMVKRLIAMVYDETKKEELTGKAYFKAELIKRGVKVKEN